MAISFVGSKSGSNTTTSTASVSLTDLLTSAGASATLATNDLVIITVVHSNASSSSRTMAQLTPSFSGSSYSTIPGFTSSVVAPTAETNVCSLGVTYKFMGSTVDTTVTIPAVAATGNSISYTIEAWRGVSLSTPFGGVTPTTANAQNTGLANPPSVTTPATAGCVVLGSFGAAVAAAAVFTNTGATAYDTTTNVFKSGIATGTNQSVSGMGAKTGIAASTAFDAAITGSTTTNTGSWCAAAYVLQPMALPVWTSGTTFSVNENSLLAYNCTATSELTPTFSIVGGADQAKFAINTVVTDRLTWASNGVKDYEAPDDADANNVYVVTLRATNAVGTTDQTVSVTVVNLDEVPATFTSSSTFSVASGSVLGATVSVDKTVNWSIMTSAQVGASVDYAQFELSSTSGTSTTLRWTSNGTRDYSSPADANADNVYAVVVQAKNPDAGATQFQTINVTVTSVTNVTSTGATPQVLALTGKTGSETVSQNLTGGVGSLTITGKQGSENVSQTLTGGTAQTLTITGKTGNGVVVGPTLNTLGWSETSYSNGTYYGIVARNAATGNRVGSFAQNKTASSTITCSDTRFSVDSSGVVTVASGATFTSGEVGTVLSLNWTETLAGGANSPNVTTLGVLVKDIAPAAGVSPAWDTNDRYSSLFPPTVTSTAVTGEGSINIPQGVRSTIGYKGDTTAKLYLKHTLTTKAASQIAVIGVAPSTFPMHHLNAVPGDNIVGAGTGITLYSSGLAYADGVVLNSGTSLFGSISPASGDVYELCIDPTNKKFWLAYNGTWAGVGGNPASGGAGMSYTTALPDIFAYCGPALNDVITANWAPTAPTGFQNFSAGEPSSSVDVTATGATVQVLSITGKTGSASAAVNGTGGVGSLTITGQTGSASANANGTGATAQVLSITGLVGSVTSSVTGTGGLGTLTLTGKTGSASADVSGTGTAGVLSLVGKTGSATSSVSATGGLGILSIAGLTGSEIVSQSLTGGVGSLTLTGKTGSASSSVSSTGATAQVLTIIGLTGSSSISYPLTAASPQVISITGLAGSSSANVTANGGVSTLAITGQTGSASANATANGGLGLLTISGKQGSVTDDVILTGQTGTLVITGLAGSVSSTVNSTGNVGNLTVTGLSGSTDLPDPFDLTTEDGAILFAEDGQDLLIEATSYSLTGQLGTLTINGLAGSFTVDENLTGQTGSLSIVGQAGSVTVDASLTGQTGALSITGKTGSSSADANATGVAGALSIAGKTGSATASANLTGQVGVVTIAGQTGSSSADANATGSVGVLSIAGQTGSSSAGVTANTNAGALTITGLVGSVDVGMNLTGQTGSLTIVGLQGSEADDANVTATGEVGHLTIAGQQGSVSSDASLQGQVGALTITGLPGTVSSNVIATGLPGEVAIMGLSGSASVSINATGQAGQLHIVGQQGAADFAGNITAQGGLGTLTIVGLAGTVSTTSNVILTGQTGLLNLSGFAGSLSSTVNAAGVTGLLNLVGKTGSSNSSVTATGQAGSLALTGKSGSLSSSVRADAGVGELIITGFVGSCSTDIELHAGEVQILAITGFAGNIGNNFIPLERRVSIAATNRKASVAATNRRASVEATNRIVSVEATNRIVSVPATNRKVVVEPTDRVVET